MRILVVEDEKKIANFIKRGLEEEHYEVHTAADGEEGFRLALEKTFDLVVLDFVVLVPGVAGAVPRAEGIEDTQRHRREARRCPSTGDVTGRATP